MSRLTDLKAAIDTAITDKNTPGSIGPNALGTQLKDIADFAASPGGNSVIRGILTQAGSAAPTFTILENSSFINNSALTTARTGAGHYKINFPSGAMFEASTIVLIGQQKPVADGAATIMYASVRDATHIIDLWSWSIGSNGFLDDLMLNVSIEILIYE